MEQKSLDICQMLVGYQLYRIVIWRIVSKLIIEPSSFACVSIYFVQSLRDDDSGFKYKIEQEILHGWLRTCAGRAMYVRRKISE